MTNEEAEKELINALCGMDFAELLYGGLISRECAMVLLDAIEKQIPKEAIQCNCPSCGFELDVWNYCPVCGQSLDWSE